MGKAYQKQKIAKGNRVPGRNPSDYAANFADFLDQRGDADALPFFFWMGPSEPHLGYDRGRGVKEGKQLEDAHLFGGWPDNDVFRGDVLDGYTEIEHADRHLGRAVALLEQRGILDETLIICTSDHGNPLARSKCNLYDAGVRVPLAVRYPPRIPAGRTVTDFASLTDIAPTVLEAAGLPIPEEATGRSLWNVLSSRNEGRIDHSRDRVVTAFERHTWCRPGGRGYPMRALHTDQFLYIRNYEPDRWPAGDPGYKALPQGFCGDVDRSPSKDLLIANRENPDYTAAFDACFGKRPAEELYDLVEDGTQTKNVADDPAYADIKAQMASQLVHYLRKTGDPRVQGETPWEAYPYHGGIPKDAANQ